MGLILIILLILIVVGALPTWPYSSGWGYYPSGGAGLVLLIHTGSSYTMKDTNTLRKTGDHPVTLRPPVARYTTRRPELNLATSQLMHKDTSSVN